jgi:hypothetical protein
MPEAQRETITQNLKLRPKRMTDERQLKLPAMRKNNWR